MNYLKQFLIILSVSAIAELINHYLPLPIPASVYGMLILLALLQFKIIKLHQVEKAADFLIAIMPIMFIPAGVGLIESFVDIQPILLPLAITTVLTTAIVMIATAKTSDFILNRKREKNE